MFELALYLLSILVLFGIIVSILVISNWAEKVKPKHDTNRLLEEQEFFEE